MILKIGFTLIAFNIILKIATLLFYFGNKQQSYVQQ